MCFSVLLLYLKYEVECDYRTIIKYLRKYGLVLNQQDGNLQHLWLLQYVALKYIFMFINFLKQYHKSCQPCL